MAYVTDRGRHLIVTGPIECTEGERAYLRLTVTQRARTVDGGRTTDAHQWLVDVTLGGEAR